MSATEMTYFVSLLGDIVSILGAEGETIVIHAEEANVVWEKNGDGYCRIITVKHSPGV